MPQVIELADGATLLLDDAFLTPEAAEELFRRLVNKADWRQEYTRGRPYPRLIAYYADEGILVGIDATGPVEEITSRAMAALRPFVR